MKLSLTHSEVVPLRQPRVAKDERCIVSAKRRARGSHLFNYASLLSSDSRYQEPKRSALTKVKASLSMMLVWFAGNKC